MEVSGSRISREDFAAYITQVSDVIAAMTKDGYPHPTAFEIETAVAFLFFKKENCDLVLLEVGMGGNLDATNIIKNTLLAVLVSISMDHMSFLGNTLAQIAEKKAGIIKDGCRVVTAGQKPEAMQVIERISREHGAKCTIADASEAEVLKESCLGQTIRYRGEEYEIPLAGVYQKENAVVALNALKVLDELGFPTAAEQKKEGLRTAGFLLPCVPIDMLLIRFKLKHLISVDFILLTMTFQSKHTLHNSQIFSCLLPMTATDINTTRFHLDPIHLHQTCILIRQTGPYPVLSCYLLGGNQLCRCHQTTVHSRRLYQLLKLNPQTTGDLPQHTQRRIGSPSLNLSQHTLTHPCLLRHLIKTHTLGFPNPLQIHRHIIR